MTSITEEWRPVRDFPRHYEVSSLARVRRAAPGKSTRSMRILTPDFTTGYARVKLHVDGVPHVRLVHRLVATAFIPNKEGKANINHVDGNRRNNAPSNLEWVTPSENTRHAWRTGLCSPIQGERHGAAKLRESDVVAIRRAYGTAARTIIQLAREYGVSDTAICCVVYRRTWRHI